MRKRRSSRSLAELASQVMAPIIEQHGLATAQVILRWAELAGPDLARVTRPLRVSWPRPADEAGIVSPQPRRMGATLVVACESAYALDLQFAIPGLIERVNLLYGWQAVTRLVIRQQPVDAPPQVTARKAPPPAPEAMTEGLQNLDDVPLRQALLRLAAGVAADRRGDIVRLTTESEEWPKKN